MVGVGVLAVTAWFAPLTFVAPVWILTFAIIGGGIMDRRNDRRNLGRQSFDQLSGFQNF